MNTVQSCLRKRFVVYLLAAPGPFPCFLTRCSTAPCPFTCCTDPPQRCTGSMKQFFEALHCCTRSIQLLISAALRRFESSHLSKEQRVPTPWRTGGLRPPFFIA
jgi:hypothetical protein